jgi:CubicO group peptidase (beta-lactamase class C family)
MATPHEALLPETSRALLHRLATAQADGRAPAMTAAVLRDGHPVWTASRGTVAGAPPDPDTQYRIGSLTKTFVALLVMRLREEGRLHLTDPIERHLPDTGLGDVTIAHLLSHTAGIASESAGAWWERTPGDLRPTLADALGKHPGLHPAGRLFHYSNPGYGVLGALVERMRGEPWGVVLRREVLEPLGMTRTTLMPQAPHASGWAVHPWADVLLPEPAEDAGVMAPAGQLWSTAADLCRWAAFLTDGDDRVLPAASVAQMRTPVSPPQSDSPEGSYGLGMQVLRVDGRSLVGHSGSMPGFLAMLWISVPDRLAGIMLANATSGPLMNAATVDLLRIVTDREPTIPEEWRPLPAFDPDLLALTGAWYWGTSGYGLRLGAERAVELVPLAARGRRSRFRPVGADTWIGLDGYYTGETLLVVREADGRVSHLDLGTFVLTRGVYEPGAVVPGGVDPAGWRPAG